MLGFILEVWLLIATQANIPLKEEKPSYSEKDLNASNYDGPTGMWCTGVNIAGFDLGALGGRNSKYYRVPKASAMEYFHNRGANCFRLPITWERLQMQLGDEDLAIVYGYEEAVDFITQNLSSWAIIDPHNNDAGLQFNYGNYERARLRDATKEDFLKLWRGLAKRFKNNPKVLFELYNEPKNGRENDRNKFFDIENDDLSGELIEAWRQWMQEAINEIRALGATNIILVPGLKYTNCRDWDGAQYWGESLDSYAPHAGNTRLASLTDPLNMLVYDVHQYFDTTWTKSFTGDQYGCDGHDAKIDGGFGADTGCLQHMTDWAKKYNKKVMVTEIASMPDPGFNPFYNYSKCQQKMHNFLQRMNDSGVFLGFQVWQGGCSACKGDLLSEMPLNLDWYGLGTWLPSPSQVPEYNSAKLMEANYAGPEGMWCTGINALGFNLDERGGRFGEDSTIPDQAAIKYFHDRGANCFRLPVTWSRLQEDLGDEKLWLVKGFEQTVEFITETLGDYLIIDPHDWFYGLKFHDGFVEEALPNKVPRVVDVTRADFVRLWHALAKKFGKNPRVIFGLYNEPKNGHDNHTNFYFKVGEDTSQMVESWRQWTQSAIDEIRALGANNTILVSGFKRSSCHDWDGGSGWGESLENASHYEGNTRLAALTDPANRLAYDVHQFFDSTATGSFTGDQYGCAGHNQTHEGYMGADEGCLTNLVKWAKTYKKKFMMTEIASMADPEDRSSWDACKSKMLNFLERMNESGVFLGYQIWQFGCPLCKGDLSTLSPSNLDWYGLDLYGTSRTSTSTTTTSTTLMTSTRTQATTTNAPRAIAGAPSTHCIAFAAAAAFGHVMSSFM